MKTLLANRLLALAGLLTLLLAGCNNTDPTDGTTRVSGQVVEQHSRRPVGNGSVQVYVQGKASSYQPLGDPQPCDAQGRFSFNFEADADRDYILRGEFDPGYVTDWVLAPELTAGRKNDNVIVPVLAPAWVKLVLVDEPPKSQVTLSIQGYRGSDEALNNPKDTIFFRPVVAEMKLSIAWFIYEAGRDRQSYTQIQAAPLDTVTVRIPF